LWDLIKEEDEEIAAMFDDLKRNNAVFKLARLKGNRIISDERFEQFSSETRLLVDSINMG